MHQLSGWHALRWRGELLRQLCQVKLRQRVSPSSFTRPHDHLCLLFPRSGMYGGSAGMSACIDCAVGKYTSSTEQTSCISCSAGKVQPSTGQTSCPDCPAGKHQTATGQTECPICGAGKYAPAPNFNIPPGGNAECTECWRNHDERAPGHGAGTGVTWIPDPQKSDAGKHDEESDCTAAGGKCNGNTDLGKVKIYD